jgi:hypothetical protein
VKQCVIKKNSFAVSVNARYIPVYCGVTGCCSLRLPDLTMKLHMPIVTVCLLARCSWNKLGFSGNRTNEVDVLRCAEI